VSTVMDSRLVGTPCYMDPEYLRTGRFGPKSDVFSMGEHGNKGDGNKGGFGRQTSIIRAVWQLLGFYTKPSEGRQGPHHMQHH
jgi:serine/threonine protein kinase